MKNIDGTTLSGMAVIMGAETVSVGLECLKNLTDPQSRTDREKNKQAHELEQGKHNLQVCREQADFTSKLMAQGEPLESALTAGENIYRPAILCTANEKEGLMKRLRESSCSSNTIACGVGLALVGLAAGYAYGRYKSSNERSNSDPLQAPGTDYTGLLEHQQEEEKKVLCKDNAPYNYIES